MKRLELIIVRSPNGVALRQERAILRPEEIDQVSIGRDEANFLCLPDPSRFVSNLHAVIRSEGDRFYVLDRSRNGIYLNGAEEAIQKNTYVELHDGDMVELGEYRLRMDVYFEEGVKGGEGVNAREVAVGSGASVGTASHSTKHQSSGVLLTALGLEGLDLDEGRSKAAEQLIAALLSESLSGLQKLLVQRGRVRGKLHSDVTLIQPEDNNPLKFTPNVKQLLSAFLTGNQSEYLAPISAVREVIEEISDHQFKLYTAGGSALEYLLEKLSPEAAASQVEEDSELSDVELQAQRWRAYCQRYRQITELFDDVQGMTAHLMSEGYNYAARETIEKTADSCRDQFEKKGSEVDAD